ncbi:MAG: hypothetical protein P8J14_13215 [Emcibacteraceae bacterium]|nr:hypothetical protein [Emcibacteraceae bacterium]
MFDKLKSLFVSKPKPLIKVEKPVVVNEAKPPINITPKDIQAASKLFWGRLPYYPQMGSVYRKIFQSLKIDNQKTVKIHATACGTDLSTLSAGGGPNIRYMCDDDQAELVERNINNMGASKKTERIVTEVTGDYADKYFAQVLSIYPDERDDNVIDWTKLAESTLPSGFIIIPRIMKPEDVEALKPAQKFSGNNDFYFFHKVDHTEYWINMLEARFEYFTTADPSKIKSPRTEVTLCFKDELTKWAIEMKRVKSGKVKIITSVYKHNDE